MKLLAALVVLSAQAIQSRVLQPALTVPDYTAEECEGWIQGGAAFDSDASGGLNNNEYAAALASFGVTTATSAAGLNFEQKTAFVSMACLCVDLGMEPSCCVGDAAQIPIAALENAEFTVQYDLCNLLATVLVSDETVATTSAPVASTVTTSAPVASTVTTSAPVAVPETYAPSVEMSMSMSMSHSMSVPPVPEEKTIIFDIPAIVDGFNAEAILANTDGNDVLGQMIKAFGILSNNVLAEPVRRKLRAVVRKLQSIYPVEVTDIPCPAGLSYAEEGDACVNFKFTVDPGEMSDDAASSYEERMTTKINEEELYDIIEETYPETFIGGAGGVTAPAPSPTPGVTEAPVTGTAPAPTDPAVEPPTEPPAPEREGLSTLTIVLIAVGVLVVILALGACLTKKKPEEAVPGPKASTTTRGVGGGPSDKAAIEAEVRRLVKETKSPKTAEELLATYAGRETVLLTNLRKMKDIQDKIPTDPAEIEAEVRALVDETKSPKTAEELLALYAGREAILIKNLRKMKANQEATAAIRAEVTELCEKVNSPKSPDELLMSYQGREEELLKNLRKLAFKQQSAEDKKAMKLEIIGLIEELELPKNPDELLATYDGREDELLKNLKVMKAKKEREAKTVELIRTLVDELALPKTADEMLASYAGREEELLNNLRKMKSKKDKDAVIKADIIALVEELDAPKSADEMLASYVGREEVLLANLMKLKANKEAAAAAVAKKEATIAEIKSLCDALTLPKSAEDMLVSYEGREEELLKNLQKMKAKEDAAAAEVAKKAATIAAITSLVTVLSLPKSAEDMLASYEGREEELLKNLTKMETKQFKEKATIAEITGLVTVLSLPKSADEMLASYKGREEDLLKNLKTMEAKQATKAATIAEITGLVTVLSLPKSADEMLASYEGREEELLKNLKKMEAKQATKAATVAEIRSTMAVLTLPKSADEMLASYEGREEELLKNLKKMAAKEGVATSVLVSVAIIAEIRKLVSELSLPKSADEMLAAYKGREEDLLKNLKMMKAKQAVGTVDPAVIAEITRLVTVLGLSKSADELLASYKGREEDLLKNLRKMKNKQAGDSATITEIRTLVGQLSLPKSADEMLAAYAGREEDLLKNLQMMKAKQGVGTVDPATIAEITRLVTVLHLPKSAEEMMESYSGREDVLLKNLKMMQAKQAGDLTTITEIRTLVGQLSLPKSADEMLAAYKGREEDLLKNLKMMKAKQAVGTVDPATIAEITRLVTVLHLPKSADEMLESYSGREDVLLKNLKMMEAKQASSSVTIAEIRDLVTVLELPKSADEMLAAYVGREEDLLRNLKKMKSDEGGADYIAEVKSLCDELKPGKTAEELLAAYKGREQELLIHLKKLKSSKK